MPYKEHKVIKKYFPIGEVTRMLEDSTGYVIAASTLRYWEFEGLIKVKHRTKNKTLSRRYTRAEYDRLELIAKLRFTYGFTIEGIKQILNDRHHKNKLVNFLLNNQFYG